MLTLTRTLPLKLEPKPYRQMVLAIPEAKPVPP